MNHYFNYRGMVVEVWILHYVQCNLHIVVLHKITLQLSEMKKCQCYQIVLQIYRILETLHTHM